MAFFVVDDSPLPPEALSKSCPARALRYRRHLKASRGFFYRLEERGEDPETSGLGVLLRRENRQAAVEISLRLIDLELEL